MFNTVCFMRYYFVKMNNYMRNDLTHSYYTLQTLLDTMTGHN